MVAFLADLPADVIFHILSKMRLRDASSLAGVSRTFRKLSGDRSFWIIALKTSPSMHSMSNPRILDDLYDMDLPTLQQLAQHCIKSDLHIIELDRNWSLPRPQIVGEVRKWRLGDRSVLETNHLFQFPGSELFVFYSSKLLKCFNFGTGESTTLLSLNGYVGSASYDFLPDKSVLLGLALRGGSRFNIPMLLFTKVGLNSDKSGISAATVLQPTLATDSDCQKPFVSPRMVGAVQSRAGGTEILAYDLVSGGHTVIVTDIPLNYTISRRLDFSFYFDSLYMLADDGPRALVYCCPKDLLPYGKQFATTATLTFGDPEPMSFPTKIWKRRGPVCSLMLPDASFVKIHDSLSIPGSHFVTTFRFWERSDLETALAPEITVPGMCSGELTLQIAPTGCHVVASLLGLGQGCSLILIRYDPELNSCSSHELELPAGVGSGPPPNILAVDDHRGIVWLFEGGDLFSIPYA
ncbi:hypothetical protein DFH07DRAFT_803346 [Mycena maculata]|uniref:F-box domain-containing protein n=1 Tax=Mycena maculata TaxID=230809 RepID=A0AAD7JUB3_9AGAR|nr:hypothetical protein DFH07DRAFT_803346 [Mycena maculata]